MQGAACSTARAPCRGTAGSETHPGPSGPAHRSVFKPDSGLGCSPGLVTLTTWLATAEGSEASCCSCSSLFLLFLPFPLRLPFPLPFLPFLRGAALGSGPLCKGQRREKRGRRGASAGGELPRVPPDLSPSLVGCLPPPGRGPGAGRAGAGRRPACRAGSRSGRPRGPARSAAAGCRPAAKERVKGVEGRGEGWFFLLFFLFPLPGRPGCVPCPWTARDSQHGHPLGPGCRHKGGRADKGTLVCSPGGKISGGGTPAPVASLPQSVLFARGP